MADQTSSFNKSISALIILAMLVSGCSGGASQSSGMSDDTSKTVGIMDYAPKANTTTTATTTAASATETPAPATSSSSDDSGGIGRSGTWFLATIGVMAAFVLVALLVTGGFDSKKDSPEKKDKDTKDQQPAELAPTKVDPQTSRADLKAGEEYGTAEETQEKSEPQATSEQLPPQQIQPQQVEETYTTQPSNVLVVPDEAAPSVEPAVASTTPQSAPAFESWQLGQPIRNIYSGKILGYSHCPAITTSGHDASGAEAAQNVVNQNP